MNKDEVKFPDGFFYKEPHENAPDFVKGGAHIIVKDFIKYLQSLDEKDLNLDFKISRENKPYAQVNEWKPEEKKKITEPEEEDDDLPF